MLKTKKKKKKKIRKKKITPDLQRRERTLAANWICKSLYGVTELELVVYCRDARIRSSPPPPFFVHFGLSRKLLAHARVNTTSVRKQIERVREREWKQRDETWKGNRKKEKAMAEEKGEKDWRRLPRDDARDTGRQVNAVVARPGENPLTLSQTGGEFLYPIPQETVVPRNYKGPGFAREHPPGKSQVTFVPLIHVPISLAFEFFSKDCANYGDNDLEKFPRGA